MKLTGIDALVFGVTDMETCRSFFADWGLAQIETQNSHTSFATLDGSEIALFASDAADLPPPMEPGPTLRRAVWGVEDAASLEALAERLSGLESYGEDGGLPSVTEPNGLRLSFRISQRRHAEVTGARMNTVDHPDARRDVRGPVYDHAQPVKIGHYVLFAPDVMAAVDFYTGQLDFVVSDYYPDAGYFLRCRPEGGHHDLFLLQTPDAKCGLNHVAFTVRDIHEVFGGGLHIARQGWKTQVGPGRHPISSAYFWYVDCPAGGLAEYYADEDWCTGNWQAKAWERTPEHYAEWAIAGGLDPKTRRQARPK